MNMMTISSPRSTKAREIETDSYPEPDDELEEPDETTRTMRTISGFRPGRGGIVKPANRII